MPAHRTLARWLGSVALAFAACAVPASAQAPPRPVGLGDALRTTLDNAPVVQTAREDVSANEGFARLARGTFDSVVTFGPRLQHLEDDIANTAFYDPERVKRGVYSGLARNRIDEEHITTG